MIQFIHTADIHFGVENYGKIDPETGIHTRLLDFRDSFSKCIDAAIEKDVDFFLFSGDAYKTAHPTPTQQKLLLEQFIRLHSAKIPAVIVVGNHDHPLSFGKAHALDVFGNLPVDGFYVVAKPQTIRLETKSGPVQVVAIPWPARHNLVSKDEHRFKHADDITKYLAQRVSQIIKHSAEQLDPTIPSVLAGHLTVSTGIFSGSEKTAVFGTDPILLPSQLSISPFDYVGLGHLHRHQNLNANGYPPVVYAGSTERVDFGERKEPKGYCHVQIGVREDEILNQVQDDIQNRVIPDPDPESHATYSSTTEMTTEDGKKLIRSCRYQFHELPVRKMIQVDIKLTEDKDQTEHILAALEAYELDGALLKIKYHVPQGKKDAVDLLAVQRACRGAQYVAGIVPVHTPVERERRAHVKVDMKLNKLLDTFFNTKHVDTKEKKELLKKAEQIQKELDEHEEG